MDVKIFRQSLLVQTIFHSFIIIGGLLTLSSCAKYKPHSFSASPSGKRIEKNNIKVSATKLTDDDCRYYFSRRILAKGYQPIQLLIKNNSNDSLVLDAWNIDLQLESSYSVAKTAELNTMQRVVGWCILGLFLWPFLIPAAVEGVKSSDANKQLMLDFEARTISRDSRTNIPPHGIFNKVMFVRAENAQSQFTIKVDNKTTNAITTFDVVA